MHSDYYIYIIIIFTRYHDDRRENGIVKSLMAQLLLRAQYISPTFDTLSGHNCTTYAVHGLR